MVVKLCAPWVAVNVAVTKVWVGVVSTAKVADFCPSKTVTDCGTVTMGLSETRLTVVPPLGATAPKVTVPTDFRPPTTALGATDTVANPEAVICRVALTDFPPDVAEIVALLAAKTDAVETVKSTDCAPAGTVTIAGKLTRADGLESKTTSPPAGAALSRLTVPFTASPPNTEVGVRTSLLTGTVFTPVPTT